LSSRAVDGAWGARETCREPPSPGPGVLQPDPNAPTRRQPGAIAACVRAAKHIYPLGPAAFRPYRRQWSLPIQSWSQDLPPGGLGRPSTRALRIPHQRHLSRSSDVGPNTCHTRPMVADSHSLPENRRWTTAGLRLYPRGDPCRICRILTEVVLA
jgi:hypothetical protein